MTDQPAAKPWIEIRRKLGPGYYRMYAEIYIRPLRVYAFGRWLLGDPWKGGAR